MAMAKNRVATVVKTQNEFNKISPDKSIIRIILFLEKNLPEFPSFANEDIDSSTNEKFKNKLLIQFLQAQNYKDELTAKSLPFIFCPNTQKSSDREEDIGVSSLGTPKNIFFTIECKRLPTPAPKCREKEYVYGEIGTKYERLGAIDRFKREHHGKGLSHSAIVAYVEKHDFNYWFDTINLWINELCKTNLDTSITWNKEDLLVKQYEKETLARYESENNRINDAIKLTHLWIKMYDNFCPKS
jgi:hypothetical protein